MKQNNRGFSLVEIVVAIAILGAFSVSICTCLVLSLRMNEKTDSLLKEQLAVSSAVETLMAEGIAGDYDFAALEAKYEVSITKDIAKDGNKELPYYDVTVESNKKNVSVTTQIRKAVPTS